MPKHLEERAAVDDVARPSATDLPVKMFGQRAFAACNTWTRTLYGTPGLWSEARAMQIAAKARLLSAGSRHTDCSRIRFDAMPATDERIAAFSHAYGLTPRQRGILVSLLRGEAPKQLAYTLGLSHTTIRFHAVQLYKRCGVQNQREVLALLARSFSSLIDTPRRR